AVARARAAGAGPWGRDGQARDRGPVRARGGLRAEPDVVLLIELLVLADRLASHEHPRGGRQVLDGDAQLRSSLAVGMDPHLGLSQGEARVAVHVVAGAARP